MGVFNYYGLIMICLIMIPNIIFMMKCKDGFTNKVTNKLIINLEQLGRFACFGLMIINIPQTYYNFWFDNGLIVYLLVDGVLILMYELIWIICFNKHLKFRSYALSIIPSILFLFSGIIILNVPLIIFAIIFGICHIYISVYNSL